MGLRIPPPSLIPHPASPSLSPLLLKHLPHPRQFLLRYALLLHQMREQLDRRSAIDLLEDALENGFAGLLSCDHREVDVRLDLAAAVRHVALELERPNHTRDAGIGEIGIDLVADFCDRRFAALPKHAHD